MRIRPRFETIVAADLWPIPGTRRGQFATYQAVAVDVHVNPSWSQRSLPPLVFVCVESHTHAPGASQPHYRPSVITPRAQSCRAHRIYPRIAGGSSEHRGKYCSQMVAKPAIVGFSYLC